MQCLKGQYENQFLTNTEYELQYCFEHKERTCCDNNDILPIRMYMGTIKKTESPEVSEMCFLTTSIAQCSKCDADVATGANTRGSLCLSFCDQWLQSCKNDLLDPYVDPKVSPPFCSEDSMLCSTIETKFDSGYEWCKFMGFQVVDGNDSTLSSTSD